jgi:hypothetical protein
VPAIEAPVAEQVLRDVLAVAPEGGRVVHCCAPDVPFEVFGNVGADALSIDAMQVATPAYDALGAAVEDGTALWLGVLAATDGAVSFDAARARLHALWTALGFPLGRLADDVVATPACGLAGASPEHARAVLGVLGELAKWLPEAGENSGIG